MSLSKSQIYTEACIKQFNNMATEAMWEVAKAILEKILDNTPVDTGALKAGFEITVVGEKIILYSKEDYWVYIELGTYKMSARPFIRPAFNDRKLIMDTLKGVVSSYERNI